MNEYAKLINNVVGAILQKEIQSLNKKISSEEINKRNNSLQLAINREFDFVQSILNNCEISKTEKNRLTKKFFKMYALEAKNGTKLNAKAIKQIRKSMVDEIENSEIAELRKKQKMQKIKDAEKVQLEMKIDKLMNEIEKVEEKDSGKKIFGATTLRSKEKFNPVTSVKKVQDKKVVAAKTIEKVAETAEGKNETALIIKEDTFINKLKRMMVETSKKIKNAFNDSQKQNTAVQPVNNVSLLSKNSTSANAFIKRVYVDMKKVNKLASSNMNYALGENKKK